MRFAVALTASLALAHAGCESCEFSFGPGSAQIVILPDAPPQDLVVEVCDSTRDAVGAVCVPATTCDEAVGVLCSPIPDLPAGALRFTAEVRYSGAFSCTTGPFVVTARAANCEEASSIQSESDEQAPRVDIVLRCR